MADIRTDTRADLLLTQSRTFQRLLSLYEEANDPDKLDELAYHTHRFYRLTLTLNNCNSRVLELINGSLTLLEDLNKENFETDSGYVAPSVYVDNQRGRPKLEIKQQQLEYLLQLGFSCRRITEVMGVSLSTVRRRMNEFGLTISSLYSCISDQELDVLVCQIKEEFPNCGYRLMGGHLLSQGHRITQAHIRESLSRVDPEGIVV
jgi:hypothetical protein